MTLAPAGAPRLFRAVVFRRAAPTSDFTCSEPITLPGRHTAADAWSAVHAVLRASAEYLGGEIRAA